MNKQLNPIIEAIRKIFDTTNIESASALQIKSGSFTIPLAQSSQHATSLTGTKNSKDLTIKDFSDIKKFIYQLGNTELLGRARRYCTETILTKPVPGDKEVVVAKRGDRLIPLVVFYDEVYDSFKWDLEDEPRFANEDWLAIPNKQVFELPLKHKFLDRGLIPKTALLITLDDPVMRFFPATETELFFSWYVGFVVANMK